MTWRPAPALVSILLDANRVAPNRSHATDGIIGDDIHQAQPTSDHNPDSRGIVHACDITNDPAGGFDSWQWAQVVVSRILAGQEHRVKYLVSNDGSKDVIWNPSVANFWRPNLHNGQTQQEHRSHLHVSILYTAAAENDQSRFFSSETTHPTPEQDDFLMGIPLDAQMILVANVADLHKLLFQGESPGADKSASMLHDIEDAITASRITPDALATALTAALAIHPPVAGTIDVKAVAGALATDLAARLKS